MAYLKELPDSWWVKISDKYTAGLPDVVGSLRGHFVAFELKSATGTASDLQEWVLKQIRDTGGGAFVVRTLQEIDDAIKSVPI